MSTPQSIALTNAQAANDALTAAANTRFIAAADAQIATAISAGQFYVSCETLDDINPQTIFQYYANLGYGVSFPDFPTNLNLQPADLFGPYWQNFWTNGGLIPSHLRKPYRLIIAWKTPIPFTFSV